MTQEQSLKVRRAQLLKEIPLEMKRVAGMAASAECLKTGNGDKCLAALIRSHTCLEEALKAIEEQPQPAQGVLLTT